MATITVRYFASIRETLGRSDERLEVAAGESVLGVWRRVSGKPLPANTLVAINHEYSTLDAPVRGGDEVAFFPPVTGG
jgi:molybdopterin synthase sulfur carrier subunit